MAWGKLIACRQIGFGDHKFWGMAILDSSSSAKNRGALNLGLLDKAIGLEKPILH
jgi:hypothetical protein